jgi:glutathione S-transferase
VSAATGLTSLLADRGADIDAIAAWLDRRDGHERLAALRGLGRDEQRSLYDRAAAAAPLDLAFFVGHAAARGEVVHEGVNTLPLPGRLRRFQKRFSRPEHGGPRLFGYNEGPTRRLIGPGYFVAVATTGRAAWADRGGVVIDYFQVPDGAVPDGWPAVVDNDRRLQRFVYHRTRDFMRRVSAHVSIGAAWKGERSLDHYFLLSRRDD